MSRPSRRVSGALCALLFSASASAQESAALFDVPVVALLADDPGFTTLLDFDGDGDLDAAGLDTNSFATIVRLALYENDGSGRYTKVWMDERAAGAQAQRDLEPRLVAGDLDGNGLQDLAISSGHEIWTYTSRSGGQTPLFQMHAEGAYVYDLLAMDVDNDGMDEVVGLTFAHLVVLDGANATRHVFPAALWNPYRLERGEISGDGRDDFLVIGYRETYFFAWTGNGILARGTFFHGLRQGMDENTAVAGDIDGDGDDDVIALEAPTYFGEARYRVLRRVGTAHWSQESIRVGTPATRLVDVDGDGTLDLAGYTGNYVSSTGSFPNNGGYGAFFWAINDGTGDFGPPQRLFAAGAPTLAGVADVDGDADLDLVGGRSLYFARTALRRSPATPLRLLTPTEGELGDAEGDGDLDIGLTLDTLLRNDLAAGFVESSPLVLGAATGEVLEGPGYPGDFDGDGDDDLLVRGTIPGRAPTWRFLRNHGGTLHVEGDAAAPGVDLGLNGRSPRETQVTDADGDGLLDLVMLPPSFSSTTSDAVIWRQVPGTTPSFSSLLRLTDRRIHWVGRIDPDPWPDLLTSFLVPSSFPRVYDTVVMVRAGLGNGTFGIEQLVTIQSGLFGQTFDPRVADFDGDGDVDFAFSQAGRIFRNDATGPRIVALTPVSFTFLPGSLVAPFGQSPLMSPLDVNADGWMDLLMWSSSAFGSDVALRIPGSAFDQNGFVLATSQALRSGPAVDIDNDGDVDLVGPEVVRNTLFHGRGDGLVRPFGESTAGTGGARPTLSTVGPTRLGSSAELRLVGARGGTFSFLALGTAETKLVSFPAPGLTFYVGGASGLFGPYPNQGPAGIPGAGSLRLPYLIDPSMAGQTIFEQILIVDGGAPFAWVASNAVEVVH